MASLQSILSKTISSCTRRNARSFTSMKSIGNGPFSAQEAVGPHAGFKAMPLVDQTSSLSFMLEHMRLDSMQTLRIQMDLLNRNGRRPRKQNHGKRPCSNVARRSKRLGRRKPLKN